MATTTTAAALPPSNAPSAEFRSHHHVEAPQIDASHFRAGWRTCSRLQGLANARLIDVQQLDAAELWGKWAARTNAPVTSGWRMRVDGGTSAWGRDPGAHQIDAAKRLRACAAAIGPERVALLHQCIVEDASWASIGRRIHRHCSTAKVRVVEAIVALERHLAAERPTGRGTP
jgi:hypothetical protein